MFEDVRVGVYRRSASEVKPEETGAPGKIKHGMRVEGPLQIRGLIKFILICFSCILCKFHSYCWNSELFTAPESMYTLDSIEMFFMQGIC